MYCFVSGQSKIICAGGIWTPNLSISKFQAHPVYTETGCSVPKTLNKCKHAIVFLTYTLNVQL